MRAKDQPPTSDPQVGGLGRFDGLRARIGLVLAPLSLLGVALAPMPGLSPEAHRLAAIVAMTVILWISEAVPLAIAALLAPALAVVFQVAPAADAFGPFAHPLIFLFIGGFVLAKALSVHGFDRRLALWLLSRRFVSGSPRRVLVAVALVAFVLSMWINNTATTAMMIPIAVGLCASMGERCPDDPEACARRDRFEEGMLICLAYAASLGGICTPIGTAPNLIAVAALDEYAGVEIDFLQWMRFGVPVGLAALALLLVFATRRWPPPVAHVEGLSESVRGELRALGPVTPAQRRVVTIFGFAVFGWLTPSFARLIWGVGSEPAVWAKAAMPEGVVAIFAAALLFVVPSGPAEGAGETGGPRSRVPALMTWPEAATIDWGTVLLMGGGLALGSLTVDTGLADAIGALVDQGLGRHPSGLLLLSTVVILVLYLTELVSNTATTNMMLPVVIPLALRAGIDPVPVALAVTLAASFAFMLPVSTPPNAIVYGSGRVTMVTMLRFGAWMDLGAILFLIAVGTWLLPAIRFW